jgi:CDP-diacylglycerol--glycerol-3-phosphate 3-phosphatidyltransferase
MGETVGAPRYAERVIGLIRGTEDMGMAGRILRRWFSPLLALCARTIIRTHITANQLTLAGLGLCALSGMLLGSGKLASAGVVLLTAGMLDALDGEVARQMARATPFGAFVDSIADHYGDFAIYVALAWHGLQAADPAVVLLTVCAMFGSIVGSQIRSRAGMLGLDTKDVGLFTRAERVIVLTIGLCSGGVALALAVLAVANNVSALQRLGHVVTQRSRFDAPVGERLADTVHLQ